MSINKPSHLANALPVGHILAAHYRIESLLGSGGFGFTYLAKDVMLDAVYAIKEYFPQPFGVRLTESTLVGTSLQMEYQWALEKFYEEARITAQVDHPNVVRIARLFEENNTAYIVFEFIDGVTLDNWLQSIQNRPSQGQLDAIIEPILEALTQCHERSILHCDLKPSNIILRNRNGSPVLIDFGAARRFGIENTDPKYAVVTPGYSPPEAYGTSRTQNQLGPWTDIYGFAATLYRALTGVTPLDSAGRMVADEYSPLRAAIGGRSGYREPFLDAIDQALALRPQLRPRSVSEWSSLLFEGKTISKGSEKRLAKEQDLNNLRQDYSEESTIIIGQVDLHEAIQFENQIGPPQNFREMTIIIGAESEIVMPRRNFNLHYAADEPTIIADPESGIPNWEPPPQTLERKAERQTVITAILDGGERVHVEINKWYSDSDTNSIILQKASETDVFLSYHRDDRARIELLAKAMMTLGWRVFWDRTILPGDRWEDVIETSIEAAKCVVVAWSGRSVKSDWVREEAAFGRERGNLVPILIEPSVRPPLGFKMIQAGDLADWDGSVEN